MASRYDQLIEKIFFAHYKGEGTAKFEFDRSEVEVWATDLGIQLPKNIGDVATRNRSIRGAFSRLSLLFIAQGFTLGPGRHVRGWARFGGLLTPR